MLHLETIDPPVYVAARLESPPLTPLVYVICQSEALANGGVESATEILRRVKAHRIVVTQKESRFTQRWRDLGCEVLVWPIPEKDSGPHAGRAARSAALPSYNARIAGLVRSRGARVVHANDIRAFWFAAPGARAAGASVVFNVRDVFEEGRPYGLRWCATHHLASEIVCLSEEMRDTARERFPPTFPRLPGRAKLSVIYSAVDLERMRPLPGDERARLRRELGIADGAFEIAYVGTFCDKKNQLAFLRETMPVIAARLPDAHVSFVGDFHPERDPYARACAEAVRELGLGDRVRFVGFDTHPERWYQAVDLVALASKYEGLPRCMIESLSCGTPVVAFDVTSVREFLEQRGCGIAVRLHDHAGLAAGIVRLAEDPGLRATTAQRAREVAVRSFDPERSVGSYLELYDRLAGARPATASAATAAAAKDG